MSIFNPGLCSRLWGDVTLNLKLKDIDAATEAKHRLEEKQRAEARERKEKERQWETRVRLSAFVSMASCHKSTAVVKTFDLINLFQTGQRKHVHA